ncbi:GAF domain-containing protein [Curtobacterium sp. SP.BCp]|uniref:GAF domain-containing protein n=1 Tax=unclassified Curtobacterium TaxID=257496 RepID=UPI0025B361F2|nr:GAF domain-containing protein [Curtobacterium sp. 458]WJX99813.1 GAF domain-containing protein [Curtobacterium sp. 458]
MTGERSMVDRRRRRAGAVVWPIVVATAPTAAFQLPNLVAGPGLKVSLVVFGLVVLLAAVVVQVVRARRAAASVAAAAAVARSTELEQGTAVRYAFGQLASRLTRFAELRRYERRQELPGFADRIAVALAFYLLPGVPDVRANVYQLSADLRALEPIGHGGAEDTAGVFRAGTPYGDRNLDWVLVGGGPRVVGDRTADVDADEDLPGFEPRYRSYVSVVIRSEEYSFGMLTVDSPAPDAFTDLDAKYVALMASFMAVAFSLASPFPDRDRNHRKGP